MDATSQARRALSINYSAVSESFITAAILSLTQRRHCCTPILPPFLFLFLRGAKNERQDSQWIKHKPEYIQAAHLIPLIPIKDMCF